MPYVKGIRGAVAEDLTGLVFGRLCVVERVASASRPKWKCVCQCSAIKAVMAVELKSGKTKSCGCYDADRKRLDTVKHGRTRTPTYNCWANMKARCENKNRSDFKNYGGRGICVCESWSEFANFLADMGEKPGGLSIDRIDNNGNYEPGNCRWATASQQRRNQRAAAEIGKASHER